MFKKFPSIKNGDQALKCRSISQDWVRQEKIHGANFQIFLGPNGVQFGSRNNELPPIGEPSDFFDYSEIVNELNERAKKFEEIIGTNEFNIYGELYGGGKKIQHEIIYSNKLKFTVFDVLIGNKWLQYDKFDKIEKAGFSVATIIETGPLNVLLNRPTEFSSEYSEKKANAEGYVVKKITECGVRHAFKNKAPSFVEAHQKKKIIQKKFEFKTMYENDELKGYIMNSNRLDALNSKIGPPKLDNVNNLARMLILDAVKDYCVVNIADIKDISKIGFSYYQETVEFIKSKIN